MSASARVRVCLFELLCIQYVYKYIYVIYILVRSFLGSLSIVVDFVVVCV